MLFIINHTAAHNIIIVIITVLYFFGDDYLWVLRQLLLCFWLSCAVLNLWTPQGSGKLLLTLLVASVNLVGVATSVCHRKYLRIIKDTLGIVWEMYAHTYPFLVPPLYN